MRGGGSMRWGRCTAWARCDRGAVGRGQCAAWARCGGGGVGRGRCAAGEGVLQGWFALRERVLWGSGLREGGSGGTPSLMY